MVNICRRFSFDLVLQVGKNLACLEEDRALYFVLGICITHTNGIWRCLAMAVAFAVGFLVRPLDFAFTAYIATGRFCFYFFISIGTKNTASTSVDECINL